MNVLILGPPFYKIISPRRGLGAVLVNVKTNYAFLFMYSCAPIYVHICTY